MGYSVELFTSEKISEEFICPICQDIVTSVRVIDPCEHVFCNDCIIRWRTTSDSCPVDRRKIRAYKEPQRMYQSLLNSLEMRCQFINEGCTSVVELGNLEDHKKCCLFNPDTKQPCAKECGATLTNTEKKAHNCAQFLKEQQKLMEAEQSARSDHLKITKAGSRNVASNHYSESSENSSTESDEDEETEDEGTHSHAPLESHARSLVLGTRSRTNFTMQEDRKILKVIMRKNWYSRTKGYKIWKLMQPHLPRHTYYSLHERFRKQIIPRLEHAEFRLTEEQISLFRENY